MINPQPRYETPLLKSKEKIRGENMIFNNDSDIPLGYKILEYRGYDFSDKYCINKSGIIYSRKSKARLKPFPDGRRGYLKVKLYAKNGVKLTLAIHRLVMENYRPIENMEKYTVDHIDGNHRNNHLRNLQWMDAFNNKAKGSPYRKMKIANNKWDICIDRYIFRKTFREIAESRNLDTQSVADFLERGTYQNFANKYLRRLLDYSLEMKKNNEKL